MTNHEFTTSLLILIVFLSDAFIVIVSLNTSKDSQFLMGHLLLEVLIDDVFKRGEPLVDCLEVSFEALNQSHLF